LWGLEIKQVYRHSMSDEKAVMAVVWTINNNRQLLDEGSHRMDSTTEQRERKAGLLRDGKMIFRCSRRNMMSAATYREMWYPHAEALHRAVDFLMTEFKKLSIEEKLRILWLMRPLYPSSF
jgi:hypothetical protein